MSSVLDSSHVEPKLTAEKRSELISERVLQVARAVAARNNRRTFKLEEVRRRVPGITSGQVDDAVAFLKDVGKVIGLGGGHYEIVDMVMLERPVGLTVMPNGKYLLTVGSAVKEEVTLEEARIMGELFNGAVARAHTAWM